MRQEPSVGFTVRLLGWYERQLASYLPARADLGAGLDRRPCKLYRKSHDQIGRYGMGLGEKTLSALAGATPRPLTRGLGIKLASGIDIFPAHHVLVQLQCPISAHFRFIAFLTFSDSK